jgi:hypothetical protein
MELNEASIRSKIPKHAESIIECLREGGGVAYYSEDTSHADPVFQHGTFVRDYWGSEVRTTYHEQISIVKDGLAVATYSRSWTDSPSEWIVHLTKDEPGPEELARRSESERAFAQAWTRELQEQSTRFKKGLCLVCGYPLSGMAKKVGRTRHFWC